MIVEFRVGNLLASAGFQALAPAAGGAAEAGAPYPATDPGTTTEAEALAARLEERIAGTLAAGEAGLAARALRLDGSGGGIASVAEGYRRLDGDVPRYYGGFEDDILRHPDDFGGAVAIYEVEHRVAPGEESDPSVLSRLFEFADEAAAAGFLAARPGSLTDDPFVTNGAVMEMGAPLGEESLAVAIDLATPDGGRAEGHGVYGRVGARVVFVLVEAGARPELGLVEGLAAAQVACVAAWGCEPVTIPEALLAGGMGDVGGSWAS